MKKAGGVRMQGGFRDLPKEKKQRARLGVSIQVPGDEDKGNDRGRSTDTGPASPDEYPSLFSAAFLQVFLPCLPRPSSIAIERAPGMCAQGVNRTEKGAETGSRKRRFHPSKNKTRIC